MLFFVPTPIGNKDDITVRALALLKDVNIVVCERVDHAKKLFRLYDIPLTEKQLFAFHSYTKYQRVYESLLQAKDDDKDVLCVSDAGTPGLSDPGKQLIQWCHDTSYSYTVLPGATALIPAIVAANFPTHRFHFVGFIPHKKGRQTLLKYMINSSEPVFAYESVHRISKTLYQLQDLGYSGIVSIAREVSKMYEQHLTCSLEDMIHSLESGILVLKGEFVLGVYPHG